MICIHTYYYIIVLWSFIFESAWRSIMHLFCFLCFSTVLPCEFAHFVAVLMAVAVLNSDFCSRSFVLSFGKSQPHGCRWRQARGIVRVSSAVKYTLNDQAEYAWLDPVKSRPCHTIFQLKHFHWTPFICTKFTIRSTAKSFFWNITRIISPPHSAYRV